MEAVLTREPGGTAVGEHVRSILLDPATIDLDDRAEALLMAAARAQHVAEVIRPALDAGRSVVTDRYAASSVAYQGHGRGLETDDILRLSTWATGGLRPDLTVLLEVDAAVARARLGVLDRFEAAGEGFHRRVAAGFRAQADADPDHWVVIDGSAPPDAVETLVRAAIEERLA
jgi:dTMP kinase